MESLLVAFILRNREISHKPVLSFSTRCIFVEMRFSSTSSYKYWHTKSFIYLLYLYTELQSYLSLKCGTEVLTQISELN